MSNGIRIARTSILLVFSLPVFASNGLNAIGFSAKSMGLAGADVAVVDDTYALNINPAGLAGIDQRPVCGHCFCLDMGHKDEYGNDVEINNDIIMFGNIAYAQKLKNSPITVGAGLFGQGGAGVKYPNLKIAFGTLRTTSRLEAVTFLIQNSHYIRRSNISLVKK